MANNNDEFIALVGYTYSNNFPTTDHLQPERAGSRDAFIVVLNIAPSPTTTTTTPPPDQVPLELMVVGAAIVGIVLVVLVCAYTRKRA
jgi:hypothetical protein